MGAAKSAGLAVAGGLGLASLATAPFALAAPSSAVVAEPASTRQTAARPTEARPTTSKPAPAPTVTKTTIKTVAPPQPCDVANGSPAAEMTRAPWPQRVLDFTDVWPLTQGAHVTVAILDSGVDTTHRQLPAAIRTYDLTGTDKRDCVGHGTMVAGIIAAQDKRDDQVPFLGVAPKARVISIKVATRPENNDPHLLAGGIRRAADLGADVINVSIQTPDFPYLRNAVEYAQRAGSLIVAAAGNTKSDKKDSEQPLYPASYPGVISVGATEEDGRLAESTDTKSRIAVVAPGKAVISTWPRNSYSLNEGTSFAAPYVAGTAVLVKSYLPGLTAQQIKHRIEATADGRTSVGTGAGMVNPLRAVTAVLPEENGQAPANTLRPKPVAVIGPEREDGFARTSALVFVGGALGIAGAVIAGGVIVPAGRRRAWRPGRRTTPDEQPDSG